VEFLSPLLLFPLFILGLVLTGWLLLRRVGALLGEKQADQSLLLMQEQIGQLRVEFGQVLDHSRLQGDLSRLRDDFGLPGKHLGHAQSIYQYAERRLEQFGQKLTSADADPKELFEPRSIERKTG